MQINYNNLIKDPDNYFEKPRSVTTDSSYGRGDPNCCGVTEYTYVYEYEKFKYTEYTFFYSNEIETKDFIYEIYFDDDIIELDIINFDYTIVYEFNIINNLDDIKKSKKLLDFTELQLEDSIIFFKEFYQETLYLEFKFDSLTGRYKLINLHILTKY